jgi:glycosyltransferase involved in cell wall biosynthesis
MLSRPTLLDSPGGDTVQIESTAKYLRRLGVRCDIWTTRGRPCYADYDILHFFNIIRPADILVHAVRTQVPCVVSTVFVDYFQYELCERAPQALRWLVRAAGPDGVEYCKCLARSFTSHEPVRSYPYLFRGHRWAVRSVIARCGLLLPNSVSEARRFSARYPWATCPALAVPNAIDTEVFCGAVRPDECYRDAVVCAARVEGRKNQLRLVRALRDTGIPLFIVGAHSPNHRRYYDACRREAGANVHFVPHLDQRALARAFAAARVHVLPSWFETTGLSSLEAAAMGCNIVVTRTGDQEEYFGGDAFYCEPGSEASIRSAVLEAYHAARQPALASRVRQLYTWDRTAAQTLRGYRMLLGEDR